MTTFPASIGRVGLLFVGGILSLLGLYLGLTGTRKLLHKHRHDHDEAPHSHYHLHLPAWLRSTSHDHGTGHGNHGHRHGVFEYLKIGMVGALFTLSPPVSMIAFISVTMSSYGSVEMVAVIAVYAAAIVTTMAIVGGGTGSVFCRLKAEGEDVHAVAQVLASLLVLGFAVTILVDALPAALG